MAPYDTACLYQTSCEWSAWASDTTSTATSWLDWNNCTTTGATGTSNVWYDWLNAKITYHVPGGALAYPKYIPAEEHYRPIRQQPAPRVITPNAQQQAAAAAEKAEKLLRQFLTPEQLRDFEQHKRFRLNVGNRQYEIDCSRRMHNVFELRNGLIVREHCIYATQGVPLADNALAQKLLLESDEDQFRRIANQTDYANPIPSPLAA